MNSAPDSIVLITDGYPYDLADGFLHDEFEEIKNHFAKITYFPLSITGKLLIEPNNQIQVDNCLINSVKKSSQNLLFKNPGLTASVFLTELFYSKKAGYILTHLRPFFRKLNQAIHLANALEMRVASFPENTIYFSTWMNTGALSLSILKRKKKINRFFFRVNGFDIFDDRMPGHYMPFRVFNFKYTHKVIVLSNVAKTYLASKQLYPEKLVVNHSGIYTNPINPFPLDEHFTLVSCSNLFEWKRVHLIASALKDLDFTITWIHIGDGKQREMTDKIIQELPPNVSVKMLGHCDQDEIRRVYRTVPINLFIHVSRTEGLGMAIIEAQSYGIPQLCCAAGGVVDVVNENTGTLIPVESSPSKIASEIKLFRNSKKNTIEFRTKVQEEFLNKFEIKKNFSQLIKIFKG
jgi:glycosyltransferase involved in cell wall biosynthesis